MPQKNSFGLPALSVRFGSNDSGTPACECRRGNSFSPTESLVFQFIARILAFSVLTRLFHDRRPDRQQYWSFHNLDDIYLFKMKVMIYILWYAPGWEDVIAQYIGGDALSYYRSAPSRERCRGDREAAGCTLGKCVALAYKMAAGWTRARKERKATGRPPKLDCKRHGKASLKLVKHPATEYGFEHPLWTCQRIRQVISAELNLAVSVPTLWRELKKPKLSCQKPERRALEQDPKARARWIATEWPRIKRLARKQRALLFFEDESVVCLTPTVGRTWAPVGKTPIVRVTGKRASVLVMSALSLQGRLFFKIPSERVNATVFIEFLKELLAEYPRRKIFGLQIRQAHTSPKA